MRRILGLSLFLISSLSFADSNPPPNSSGDVSSGLQAWATRNQCYQQLREHVVNPSLAQKQQCQAQYKTSIQKAHNSMQTQMFASS